MCSESARQCSICIFDFVLVCAWLLDRGCLRRRKASKARHGCASWLQQMPPTGQIASLSMRVFTMSRCLLVDFVPAKGHLHSPRNPSRLVLESDRQDTTAVTPHEPDEARDTLVCRPDLLTANTSYTKPKTTFSSLASSPVSTLELPEHRVSNARHATEARYTSDLLPHQSTSTFREASGAHIVG